MGLKRALLTIPFVWLSLCVWGQLSDGGEPMDLPVPLSVKSKSVFVLAPVDNQLLLKRSVANWSENHLKPFRFAKPVSVSLNTENSGRWIEDGNYLIWQLVLVSEGAKSLNLIFNHFNVPEGARLFLFSPDRTDVIGAFTSKNNKVSGVLATSPVIGDHLVVQYEEPKSVPFDGQLEISQVNHDFIGIKSLKSDRRPLGVSGACNVNINCDLAERYKMESHAICRILVSGIDLCTGALVNNTNEDGTPYVYTAGHCIDNNKSANESIFLFNYESPYCGDIDGDVSHSLSGSALKAASDSLDFSLVELSEIPPANYRPYYLGWDRGTGVPDSSVCIHQPLGDVKKIAIDRNSPLIKTYSVDYLKNDFFLIGNWEKGTTEGGSSGAPLINQNKLLVGSLTGGAATCENPFDDYFERFCNAWDYYSQSYMQLKRWLDPKGTNPQTINGYNPYTKEETCSAFTNFKNSDTYSNLTISGGKGYWAGNNTAGITGFAERFEVAKSAEIVGASFGVAKAISGNANSDGKVAISVYQGATIPDSLLYTQLFDLDQFDEGVMNYLEFAEKVKTVGTFFISYSLDYLLPTDTFSVYLADRNVDPYNSYYLKQDGEWHSYPDLSNSQAGTSMLVEVLLSNLDAVSDTSQLKSVSTDFKVFPNPVRYGQTLYLEFKKSVSPGIVQVFNLLGKRCQVGYKILDDKWLSFDFSQQVPGNYFIKIVDGRKRYHARVVYIGN